MVLRGILLTTLACVVSLTSQANPAFSEQSGCREGAMAEFGQYLGNWNIRDYALSEDGTSWEEQTGARWNFACLGNGVAVQDFWLPNGGGTGTNLRMYNAKTESWDVVWTSTGTPFMSQITAKQQANGNIVMTYVSPKPTPARRITFFPANKDSWRWRLELSSDEEKTWLEVYRIEATRAD